MLCMFLFFILRSEIKQLLDGECGFCLQFSIFFPVITVASSSLSVAVKDGESIEEVQEENIQEVDVR